MTYGHRKKKIWHSAFADSVFHEKIKTLSNEKTYRDFGTGDDFSSGGPKLRIFKFAVLTIALIFIGRLFQLTVVLGSENKELSENNRVRLIEVPAVRGKIIDRNGKNLVESKEIFKLILNGKSTNISEEQVADLEKQGLAGEIFEGELGKIEADIKREYLLGEAASHVLGYISVFQGTKEDAERGFSAGDMIGRLGLEDFYDNFLKGNKGRKLIEVDAIGNKVSVLGEELPEKGLDIKTTIDGDLQKVVFEVLKKHANRAGSHRGAVIVEDPQSGAVLALVSVPTYDPSDVGRFVTSENKPFFNRAIQGNYPPGSVFKIVSALAGLESGTVSPDTEIEDVGQFTLGGVKFSNWYFNNYGRKDGNVNMEKAIARSNDIYFYRLAQKTGLVTIRKMALKFGFGQKSGIDLPGETFGLVPDEVWKRSVLGETWFLGDTLNLAIGQGFMLATPMQISNMTSYMAVGKFFKPYLVSRIGEGEGSIKVESKVTGENLAGGENYEAVRVGMRQACSRGGTAFPFFEAPYTVGCKTGTAEQSVGNPNAWFTVFAPFENPRITVTVLIEDGGEGSSVAAPVAREILDWWFSKR